MRVILDTNIWRYLVDNNCQDKLFEVTHKQDIKVVIAPGVVIETLRMKDAALRKKIVELQTRDCWERLMPDAFLQCEDVKREMIRLHPDWVLKKPNTTRFNNLRYDWIRAKGGFWTEARTNTNKIATFYQSKKDDLALEVVRQQSRDVRAAVLEQGKSMLNGNSLQMIVASYKTANGSKITLDGWRFHAMSVWSTMLGSNTVLQQWTSCAIHISLMLNHYTQEFIDFWRSEVNVHSVPREWLRFALYVLQSERKVTDGNPFDSSLAVHLLDADIFVSADKNFVSMANKIHNEAPFKTAHGFLMTADKDGVSQLFQAFSERFSM